MITDSMGFFVDAFPSSAMRPLTSGLRRLVGRTAQAAMVAQAACPPTALTARGRRVCARCRVTPAAVASQVDYYGFLFILNFILRAASGLGIPSITQYTEE